MKTLPPQRLRPHYYESVEQSLRDAFADILFKPLDLILLAGVPAASGFINTAQPPDPAILKALRRGVLQYKDGIVTGEFDASLSKALRALGAEVDARTGAFRLPELLAPSWFRLEAAAAQKRAEAVHDALLRELDRIQNRLETGMVPVPIDASVPVEAIEEGFESAASVIGISKRIPPAARAAMEARYAAQVRPFVVSATAEYIDDLHKAVTANAARGFRYENLVDEIQHAVGVSERKARFLARQETSLFMSGYRRERFTAAGVWRYKWATSHDIRVRPYADSQKLKKYGDHRVLDKMIFTYELKAPAQYMSCKKPCNPGEDFGCRCADLAVLE